jgi:hypothetical protein
VAAAVVVGLVVGAVTEIGPASGPYRRTIDRGFAALASSVAAESNSTGRALIAVLTNGQSLERSVFFSTLDTLATQAAAQAEQLENFSPPSPDAGAGSGCQSAIAGRATATAGIRQALEGLLGGTTGASPLSMGTSYTDLESTATMLSQADAAWSSCRRSLQRAPGTPKVAASRWITDPGRWSPQSLTALVDSLVLSPTLLAHPSLAVDTVEIVPAPLPGTGPAQVPTTSSLGVHVVVSNDGNVDEPGIAVRAALISASGGGPPPQSAIVAVESGRSLAVVLGPFAVVPGTAYTLEVTVTPPAGPGAATSTTALQVLPTPTTTTTTTTTTTPRRS